MIAANLLPCVISRNKAGRHQFHPLLFFLAPVGKESHVVTLGFFVVSRCGRLGRFFQKYSLLVIFQHEFSTIYMLVLTVLLFV